MAKVFPVELIFKLEEKLGKEEAKEFVEVVEQAINELTILRKLELKDELTKELATKADIREVRAEIMEVRAEIDKVRAEFGSEIKEVRVEFGSEIKKLRVEIDKMRAELGSEIKEVRAEVDKVRAEIMEVRAELNARIDKLEARMDKLEFYVKLMIGLLLLAIALYSPVFAEIVKALLR